VTISRQVADSESNPLDAVDLLLGINGIPIATAELKTQHTNQHVDHAIHQYRHDRAPSDLLFRSRTVVLFAVDQDNVYMTTRLAGADTVFLPFNQGSNGPGRDGGRGNPLNPVGARTAYLWEQVWARDAWLDLIGSYVHVEHLRDATGRRTGQTITVFPRYHQWHAVTRLASPTPSPGSPTGSPACTTQPTSRCSTRSSSSPTGWCSTASCRTPSRPSSTPPA
jgi:type I restriction enzyme, R subunit